MTDAATMIATQEVVTVFRTWCTTNLLVIECGSPRGTMLDGILRW